MALQRRSQDSERGGGAEPNCCVRQHVDMYIIVKCKWVGGDWVEGDNFSQGACAPHASLPLATPLWHCLRLRQRGRDMPPAARRSQRCEKLQETAVTLYCASTGNRFRFSFSSLPFLLRFVGRLRHSRVLNCMRFGYKREAIRERFIALFLVT